MDRRLEFVRLADAPGANVSELCRRFGVSRSNGYKWLARWRAEGAAGLAERSRRPRRSPARTPSAIEEAVLAVRRESNGAWGGRKIAAVLARQGCAAPPAPATITAILRRRGVLSPERAGEHPGPFRRFERAQPNELWQMDFKGHFAIAAGRCHPLTVLDDHSRYALVVEACADERDATVRGRLTAAFRVYGLPLAMLADNGSPWGDAGDQPYTALGIWLMRLGVRLSHGRPRHPQTQGKDERFHRTLAAEALAGRSFADLPACQAAFDRWRGRYNHLRPHEALGMEAPASRFRPSPRAFPETLPEIVYGPGDLVRKVDACGLLSFKGRPWRVGKAFAGLPVGLRATPEDGVFEARFCAHRIGALDLRAGVFTPRRKPAPAPAAEPADA